MTPDQVTDIPITSISIATGRRKLDPAWVDTLAASIGESGQMLPIEVVAQSDGGYRLVFGGHRLAATQRLGRASIRAIVRDPSVLSGQMEVRLREIAENLIRRELSVLDRSVDIAAWREIYEAAHLTAKPGRKRKEANDEQDDELSAKFALNFSEAAQQTLGISRRSIFLALKIASIPASVRDRIALHPIADNQSELLHLAAEPADRQGNVVDLLTAEPPKASSVATALAVLDRAAPPAKAPRWQKVSSAFSQLKTSEQDAFFELHEAAISRWLKGRAI